jgi:transposase
MDTKIGVNTMESEVKKRLKLVQTYKKTGSLRATAKATHTDVKTVRKWVVRYKKSGQKGLLDQRFKVSKKS